MKVIIAATALLAATQIASAQSTPNQETIEEIVALLIQPMDRKATVDELHADCIYRFPRGGSVVDVCIQENLATIETIRKEMDRPRHELVPGIIVVCMDSNRSLNGFDWRSVSHCYERMMVAMRGMMK